GANCHWFNHLVLGLVEFFRNPWLISILDFGFDPSTGVTLSLSKGSGQASSVQVSRTILD
ncbi:hypothetical protein, partial [Nostoc sp.]